MNNSLISQRINSLTLGEISRRLYKPHWADAVEYKQALNAIGKATQEQLDAVKAFAVSNGYKVS